VENITTRLAKVSDAAFLKEMNDIFNGPGVTEESVADALRTNPNEIVGIVEYDGVLAGFCCAQITRSICSIEPAGEITELFILEQYRRKGCAERIVTFLENIMQKQYGVEELRLLTGSDNIAAQKLYEGLDYCREDEMLYIK